MARIRTIKPDFFRHEELYQAEIETGLPLRVAFAGMFTVSDREGRFKWKPKQLKFDVLPYDDLDFEEVLAALEKYDFIVRYVVDGKEYGCIPTFTTHQVINNKESKSLLPEPPLEKTRLLHDVNTSLTEGKGRERKGREHIQVASAVCEIFGKEYLLPDERLSVTANWFKTIDYQTNQIMQVWPADVAVKQIRAYIRHCKTNNRKLIATDYKVAETILSIDWMKISEPSGQARASPYSEAEFNRTIWTDEAWRKQYAKQIASDEGFRKHFKLTTQ